MKKYIKASSGKASDVPIDLRPYYYAASKGEAAVAGFDSDFIGDKETTDIYSSYGYTWDGIILARPEYLDVLEDSGYGCLDVAVDPDGNLVATQIVHDRLYEITYDEIENALPADMIADESSYGVVESAEAITAFTLIDYCVSDPAEMVSHPTSTDEGMVEDWDTLYEDILEGSLDPVDFELDDIDQNVYVFLDGGDMIHLKDGTWVNLCWRGGTCHVWPEKDNGLISDLNAKLKG